MNKKLPFTPNETDAILYVIISVLLLMSVNQVLSQPLSKRVMAEKCWQVSLDNKKSVAHLALLVNTSNYQTPCSVERFEDFESSIILFCDDGGFVIPERKSRQFVGFAPSIVSGSV